MNIRFKSRYLVLLLSASVFFSCKKDDTPGTPTPEQKPTLFETVQGKWNTGVLPPARVSNQPVITSSKLSKKVQDMGYISSVEFFKDSSCLVVFNYGYGFYHKITIEDSTTFSFGDEFGDFSGIKVEGDSISFSFNYGDEPVSIKAAKVADLVLSQDKKALVKEWYVTHEEDGDSLYHSNGNDSYPDGTQIYLQFTGAGTFVEKISYDNESMVMALGWKLDPDHSDIIKLESSYFNVHGSYIKILSLTESTATIQLVTYTEEYNNNSNKVSGEPDYVEQVATLVLTKK
jgi:hypothetical protein